MPGQVAGVFDFHPELGQEAVVDDFDQLLRLLADLRAIALVSSILAEKASDAQSVATELIALLDASELDSDEIRPRAVALTIWMQRQPNGRVQAAIDKLLRQERALHG